MPLKGYFLWIGLALCAALYGAAFALGPVEIRPNGVQELPLEIQKMRAQQTKGKAGPQAQLRVPSDAS
jgi:hypothetical protein